MRRYKGIYFDHAATSYPKPKAVLRAVSQALVEEGGNPGRSAHALSLKAAERVSSARETLASFFGLRDERGVVFTKNATEALNLAVHTLTAAGGHVLCDDMAHNALLRPLYALADAGKISLSFFSAREASNALTAQLREETVLVCVTHASNICSETCDVAGIGAVCKARGIAFLVDASQSAGHIPIDCEALGADAVCVPAHKGCFGVMGAGAVLFPHPKEEYPPFLFGGSGAHSRERGMPRTLPERFEAGTLPLPAIAAFEAGVRRVEEVGVLEIGHKIKAMEELLKEGLGSIEGITLFGEGVGGGILSFAHRERSPNALADALGAEGICVRAGLHCAPLAHQTLGTPREGTVRVSLGYTNTKRECERFLSVLSRVLK